MAPPTSPIQKRPKQAIFDNDYVTELCLQFKRDPSLTTFRLICEGSNNLIDSIIRSNKFHLQAPFDDIKNYLYLQIENWINKWNPEKGKTYTYFSICTKHAAISYVSKESLLRQRFVFTDLPMEALSNACYVPQFSSELRQSLIDSLKDLEIRWREPVVQKVIRYLICCIVHNRIDRRQDILRTITLGFPIDLPTAKFLFDWSQAAVRISLLERYEQPLGEIDIIRASERFSHMPDIIALIGLQNAKKMMAAFAGMTLRFPSQTQLRRHTAYRKIYDTLATDPSPEAISSLAKEFRTTPDKVEVYNEMLHTHVQAGLIDDIPLYGDHDVTAERLTGQVLDGPDVPDDDDM